MIESWRKLSSKILKILLFFYGTANILSALHGRRKLLENNCLYQSLSRTFHPLPKYTREARWRSPAKSIRTNRTASKNTAALLPQNKNSRIFLMRSDSYRLDFVSNAFLKSLISFLAAYNTAEPHELLHTLHPRQQIPKNHSAQ